ncbi:tellurium resistance protein TerD [Novosphingobium indicum]|uniref:Tellurium resistance protein TerD n=1 Tax=Novosphingobium indicum TaxID=462949 RepID=A0ABQ2JY83_9SPHN|nr:TerD family protein [Novosphingobium indicum]GGN60433.1 tellurium resistance protein TerD [Novosphingobium indicum]
MAISLEKGGNVSLSQSEPGLRRILVGLGWDARSSDGADFDLDASALLLGKDHKVLSEDCFVFYNNLTSPDGSVEHTGDNITGEGDGDDEAIKIDLERVPAEVEVVAIAVTIHDAESRRQNFGQVRNAFIRIVNDETDKEIARYDLSEDYSVETAMLFGEVYRRSGEWKFRAVGQGYSGGLRAICEQFGIEVA